MSLMPLVPQGPLMSLMPLVSLMSLMSLVPSSESRAARSVWWRRGEPGAMATFSGRRLALHGVWEPQHALARLLLWAAWQVPEST